jgi:hypothetical protein
MVPEVYQVFWAGMAAGEFISDAAIAAGSCRKQGSRWQKGYAAPMAAIIPATVGQLRSEREVPDDGVPLDHGELVSTNSTTVAANNNAPNRFPCSTPPLRTSRPRRAGMRRQGTEEICPSSAATLGRRSYT